MSTRWMLNSSILSMITSRLSWGSLLPWLSLSEKTILVRHSLASSLEGPANGRCLFLSPVLFSGISAFYLPLGLPRLSLFLLQGVCYPLPLEFCLDHPFVGTGGAPSFWRTFVTSLARLKSPPSLSNVCTHQYNACGPGGIYSTCFCLFFLMEC